MKEVRAGIELKEVRAGVELKEVRAGVELKEVRAGIELKEVRAGIELKEVRVGIELKEVRAGVELKVRAGIELKEIIAMLENGVWVFDFATQCGITEKQLQRIINDSTQIMRRRWKNPSTVTQSFYAVHSTYGNGYCPSILNTYHHTAAKQIHKI